jgi:hypothetical protein
MSKQKKIRYDRSNWLIEVASIHPDDIGSAQTQIANGLRGLGVKYMGMFGTIFLESNLTDEDILVINLSITGNYELVADNSGLVNGIFT